MASPADATLELRNAASQNCFEVFGVELCGFGGFREGSRSVSSTGVSVRVEGFRGACWDLGSVEPGSLKPSAR